MASIEKLPGAGAASSASAYLEVANTHGGAGTSDGFDAAHTAARAPHDAAVRQLPAPVTARDARHDESAPPAQAAAEKIAALESEIESLKLAADVSLADTKKYYESREKALLEDAQVLPTLKQEQEEQFKWVLTLPNEHNQKLTGSFPRYWLTQHDENSLLARQYSGRFDYARNEEGAALLTVQPHVWQHLVTWMGYGIVPPQPSSELVGIAQFFAMDKMLEAMQPAPIQRALIDPTSYTLRDDDSGKVVAQPFGEPGRGGFQAAVTMKKSSLEFTAYSRKYAFCVQTGSLYVASCSDNVHVAFSSGAKSTQHRALGESMAETLKEIWHIGNWKELIVDLDGRQTRVDNPSVISLDGLLRFGFWVTP